MPIHYDAIVVGSGLGGLTAGALCAREGMRVLVLERHGKFGGCATTFKRNGMTFEVGLHGLDGLDRADAKRSLFEGLGIFDAIEFTPIQTLYGVRHRILHEEFVMPVGFDAAVAAACARFPHRQKAIQKYFRFLRNVRDAVYFYGSNSKSSSWWLRNVFRIPKYLWLLFGNEQKTLSSFLHDLFGDDEAVKIALWANVGYFSENPATVSTIYSAVGQASYIIGGAYYIKSGSQTLSDYLISLIRKAGGDAYTHRVVTRILMENGRAVGVEHGEARPIEERGWKSEGQGAAEQAFAPIVFGNASPHALKTMLPEEYQELFFTPYKGRPTSISLWNVYLILDRKPSAFGVTQYSTFLYPSWLRRLNEFSRSSVLMESNPGSDMPGFVFVDYSMIDSGLSIPDRHYAVLCGVDQIENWSRLDEQTYKDRKARWMDALIATIDRAFPGISRSIVYKEMSTAWTIQRHIHTPGGAVYGFTQEPEHSGRYRPGAKTAIQGLWLASVFAKPGGGFTGAMLAGENAFLDATKDLRRKR
ncbi:MAG: phytoene desaturase family protein [bacterium]